MLIARSRQWRHAQPRNWTLRAALVAWDSQWRYAQPCAARTGQRERCMPSCTQRGAHIAWDR